MPQSSNFELSQKGMEQQFADLHSLLQVHDPNFCAYLDRNDSSRMSFTFRWAASDGAPCLYRAVLGQVSELKGFTDSDR